MHWAVTATLGAGAALLVSACGDNEPFVGYVRRSTYFAYHERSDSLLCPTLLSRLDEHVEVIGKKIGLKPDTTHPFYYERFRDIEDFRENSDCNVPDGLNGCADGDITLSTEAFHSHELVHTYVFRAWGRHSVGLLTEGVAAALSCQPFYPLQPDQTAREVLLPLLGSLGWKELLDIGGDTNAGYGAAGFFVTHLANLHGWASVAELYRRVPPHSDAATFEREFSSVYSTTMDQTWSEALDKPGGTSCQMDWPCNTTRLKVGLQAMPDCDGEFHRRIDLAEPGGVVLSLAGRETELRLLDCTTATPTIYGLFGGQATSSGVHWASMPPGSYTMFRGRGQLPSEVELRSILSQDWIASSCESAETVSLDPSAESTLEFPAGAIPFTSTSTGDNTAWIRIAGAGRRYDITTLDLLWTGVQPDAAVELCDNCDSTQDCIALTQGEVSSVVIGNTAALKMQHAFSLPPPSDAWGRIVFRHSP